MDLAMTGKKARQDRIVGIVEKNRISSQEQLAACLKSAGFSVTQSTLSRDVREMGLVKVRGHYRLPGDAAAAPPAEILRRSFRQLVLRSGVSGNMLMVRTLPGSGHSLGVVLDAAQWPEVLGTVAGDDTVFVLLRSSRLGKKVLRRLEELLR